MDDWLSGYNFVHTKSGIVLTDVAAETGSVCQLVINTYIVRLDLCALHTAGGFEHELKVAYGTHCMS